MVLVNRAFWRCYPVTGRVVFALPGGVLTLRFSGLAVSMSSDGESGGSDWDANMRLFASCWASFVGGGSFGGVGIVLSLSWGILHGAFAVFVGVSFGSSGCALVSSFSCTWCLSDFVYTGHAFLGSGQAWSLCHTVIGTCILSDNVSGGTWLHEGHCVCGCGGWSAAIAAYPCLATHP